MASATKQTSRIRKTKLSKKGRVRKAKLRSQGSTKTASQLFGDEK